MKASASKWGAKGLTHRATATSRTELLASDQEAAAALADQGLYILVAGEAVHPAHAFHLRPQSTVRHGVEDAMARCRQKPIRVPTDGGTMPPPCRDLGIAWSGSGFHLDYLQKSPARRFRMWSILTRFLFWTLVKLAEPVASELLLPLTGSVGGCEKRPKIPRENQERRILARDDKSRGASWVSMATETMKSTPCCLRCGAELVAEKSLPTVYLVCPNYPDCQSPPPVYQCRQAA